MGRVLLAAAAAISLFALPGAAFGQGAAEQPGVAVAQPPAAPPRTDARFLAFESARTLDDVGASRIAAEDADRIAALVFGITADSNSLPQFSWGIPRSPALTLAGLADAKVSTSDSLRSFVVSLPTTLNNDEQGQAIALDASLSQFFSGDRSETSLHRYRGETYRSALVVDDSGGNSPYQRWLARTRVGIALYEGVENNDDPTKNVPARLAFGLSTSLWDESDPVAQDGPGGNSFQRECARDVALQTMGRSADAWFSANGLTTMSPGNRNLLATNLLAQSLGLQSAETFRMSRSDQRESMERMLVAENFAATTNQAERRLADDPVARGIILEATKECAQRASQIAELRRDLDIGIGVLYRGEPGQFSEFDDRGAAAWVAFRYPWGVNLANPDFGTRLVNRDSRNANSTDPLAGIDSYWLVAGSARFSQDEFIATGNDATPEIQVDQAEAWIGLERYSQRFRFGAFYGYSEVEAAEPAGQPFERSGERYVISAQYRLGDEDDSGLWLGVTYGDTGNAANADNDDALMFSINFAPQPAYTIDWDPDN